MKSLIIILTILFISCNDKDDSTVVSTVVETIEDSVSEPNPEYGSYNSSESLKTELYKGTLNETTVIWLYIKEQEHPCGGTLTMIDAMYRYDNQEKWLLLEVTTDKKKQNYCLVEDNFTGVLFLEARKDSFKGNWVSPNTKKQFKVELHKVDLTKEENEKLEETLLDDLLYNKNDC